jgi:hypothetical protein
MRHAPLVILLVAIHIGALQAQLVRGQVVDSITGVSLARSMVILTSADGTEADRTTTDNRGFFLLRAPSHGSYYLIAVHEGYRHLIFPPFDLEAERMRSFVLLLTSLDAVPGTRSQQSEELAIKLCPTNTDGGRRVIVGTVSDAVTGETASGAQVHFSAPTAPGPETDSVPPRWSGQTTVLTGDDGTYALCDVPVMSRISVHAMEGDRRSSFDVVMFGATGVFHGGTFHSLTRPVWQQDLVLFPTDEQMARVTGFVKDTVGNAIPGAVVQIVGAPRRYRYRRRCWPWDRLRSDSATSMSSATRCGITVGWMASSSDGPHCRKAVLRHATIGGRGYPRFRVKSSRGYAGTVGQRCSVRAMIRLRGTSWMGCTWDRHGPSCWTTSRKTG